MGSGELPGGRTPGRVTRSNSTGTEASVLGTFPNLALCISSSGYSSESFIISSNKLVKVGKCFPEVCEPLKRINQIPRVGGGAGWREWKVMGTSDLQPSQAELWVTWGLNYLRLASEVGAVSWDLTLSPGR